MRHFRNAERLIQGERSRLREIALAIADTAIDSLDPVNALAPLVKRVGDTLQVDGQSHSLARRVHLIGAGKATLKFATVLEEMLGDHLDSGLIVVPESHAGELGRVAVTIGDHPVPGDRSIEAGRMMLSYADSVGPDDLVISVFTGGSSALVSVPPDGIDEDDKRQLHSVLLMSGLDVVRMNTVRKHASLIKGGRLALRLGAGQIVNLTVSDVAGDVVDAITDPTVEDSTKPDAALVILEEASLTRLLSPSILRHLDSARAESPELDGIPIQTVLVANGRTVCGAMAIRAESFGCAAQVSSIEWAGDAEDFGRRLGEIAGALPMDDECQAAIGCGGETTVAIDGLAATGAGGPNQEVAIAAALAIDGTRPVAVLAMDTDGSDGGSPFAGGIVDDLTASEWRKADVDAPGLLRRHQSSRALSHLDLGLDTGPTFTNANDLFVVVAGKEA